ncbi:MAG TPA: glycosyltransferase family 4 protein [Polyangiaceae bacterium]
MKVLFLSPDFVIPTESGLRVRTLSQLKLLADVEQVTEITLLSLSATDVPAERRRALEKLVPKLRVEEPIVRPLRIRQGVRTFADFLKKRVLRRLPYLIAVNDCARMHRIVEAELRRTDYDVVYFGYLGVMAYYDLVRKLSPRARCILEEHNIEWQIFDRLAPTLKSPLRYVAELEARALREYERDALTKCDAVIAISETDAQLLRTLSGATVTVVPPFVETRQRPAIVTDRPKLTYFGHLTWQPNVLGLDWFCSEVWPKVLSSIADATLTIAGPGLRPGPDAQLIVPDAWKRPGIHTVGFVDDLDDLYRETRVVVAPVHGGSGVRMKILETLSAGMPTITTSDGAAGLALRDGQEVLIADDPTAFAAGVIRLLSDADFRQRLSDCGYEYINRYHAKSSTRRCLASALGARDP